MAEECKRRWGRKLLGAVTQRKAAASLKIMSAYKLNVRGPGRVRCLLKRSQPRKKNKKTTLEIVNAGARTHTDAINLSVPFHCRRAANSE